ncbi:MAG: ABC transporter ATP-binding protein [Anaerolineaceae bacterium]|nr:ABC transporter ATP-binding protein [Anaerolineaceae bacterium]
MTTLLKANALSKNFGRKQILRDLNFELESGHVTGLLGPNGAGKTTLIKTLMGIYPVNSGGIEICGEQQSYKSRAHLAYLPDMNHLMPWMCVRDAIHYYHDMFADFDLQRSAVFSEMLKLDLNERIQQMSRGMQQRTLIMLTLSRNAKLYLLDEPLGGIDPLGVDKILKTIFSGLGEESSILISTHRVKEIETLVDEVYFIDEGQFIYHADAESIRSEKNQSIEECYLEVFENA